MQLAEIPKRACTQIGIESRNTRQSRCRCVVECGRRSVQDRGSVIGWSEPLFGCVSEECESVACAVGRMTGPIDPQWMIIADFV